MPPPFFSVIIPLFNKAPTIKRTLTALLNQAYPHFEVCLVDDGSTDAGLALAKTFTDPRLSFFKQKNAGPAAARNYGARQAKAAFLVFLDADDTWHPQFLTTIHSLIQSYPNAGAFATYFQFVKGHKTFSPPLPPLFHSVPHPPCGLIQNYFHSLSKIPFFFLTASSTCIPKEKFLAVGGFPNATLREDVALWTKLALRYPVAFHSAVLVSYYQDVPHQWSKTPKPVLKYADSLILEEALEGAKTAKIAKAVKDPLTRRAIKIILANNLLYQATGNLRRGYRMLAKETLRSPALRRSPFRKKLYLARLLCHLPPRLTRLLFRCFDAYKY